MLWACLHFFDLPLHAAFDADERSLPCALTAGPRQRPQIVMANAAALRLGVRHAQPLAAARACCAQLLARARDEPAELRLLHSLAAWAYRFSSHVSIDGADALLVEVGASLRLFGGWSALDRRLRGDLDTIGHAPRIAVAPVARAARVLVRSDGFFTDGHESMLAALGNVPLADSGLDASAISLLCNVGLRTLREVFALPSPELARRIGLPAIEALERMRGLVPAPLLLYRPAERFDHRIEFEAGIASWPPLLFPLRRLCEEFSLFLAARDGGVQRCALVLEHEDRAPTRIAIELLTPQREARTLYDLIRSRLERAILAAPACAIALVARELPALRPRHADLFETRRTQALDWPDLAERLRSKLGDESVRRLARAGDHRPEFAWCFDADRAPAQPRDARAAAKPRGRPRAIKTATTTPLPGGAAAATKDADARSGRLPRLRPLWLLRRALPLAGIAQVLAGPERIESGWWDGGDVRRDYYVVRLDSGQHAWAFHAPGADGGWMLHGWFA